MSTIRTTDPDLIRKCMGETPPEIHAKAPEWLKVGAKVVCVRDNWKYDMIDADGNKPSHFPIKNWIYEIMSIGYNPDFEHVQGCGGILIAVRECPEVTASGWPWYWVYTWFAPLKFAAEELKLEKEKPINADAR